MPDIVKDKGVLVASPARNPGFLKGNLQAFPNIRKTLTLVKKHVAVMGLRGMLFRVL